MATPPSKRRKISRLPEAPTTPSRIPKPSFASPTKSSLARHNPQLLGRSTSVGNGSQTLGSRGGLEGIEKTGSFAAATREPQRSSIPITPLRFQDASGASKSSAIVPSSARAAGKGFFAKPRRNSHSPMKQFENPAVEKDFEATIQNAGRDANPFQRKGLRRSPVGSQEQQESTVSGRVSSFKRRSPVGAQELQPQAANTVLLNEIGLGWELNSTMPVESREQTDTKSNQNHISTTIPDLVMPQSSTESTRLSRSPRIGEIKEPIEASVERISLRLAGSSDITSNPLEEALIQRKLQSRKSPNEGFTEALQPTDEPQFRPSPAQRGKPEPIVTTPPSGIQGTPSSRKAKGERALSADLRSSPLQSRYAAPVVPVRERLVVPEKVIEKSGKKRKSARLSIALNQDVGKKQIRDNLLLELQQIQADVALANKENERLRHQLQSKRKLFKSADPEGVRAMLLRSLPNSTPKTTTHSSIFKATNSFLPFSALAKTKFVPPPSFNKPPPSHAPLQTDNPLPHLQLFSPLLYTSTITLLPNPVTHDNINSSFLSDISALQQHHITARHPTGLFVSRFIMTIQPATSTTTPSIQSIDIANLDAASEAELGPFVRQRASEDYVLGKGIGVIGWAMGRWAEIAINRAGFWCAVEREMGSPSARKKTLNIMRQSSKVGRRAGHDDGHADDAEDRGISKGRGHGKSTRQQLLRNMGRTTMEVRDEESNIELRLEWSITFDWTGEAESRISAGARFPTGWQETDDRQSLSRIPDMFDRMAREQGPLDAVRAVVGLLMVGSGS